MGDEDGADAEKDADATDNDEEEEGTATLVATVVADIVDPDEVATDVCGECDGTILFNMSVLAMTDVGGLGAEVDRIIVGNGITTVDGAVISPSSSIDDDADDSNFTFDFDADATEGAGMIAVFVSEARDCRSATAGGGLGRRGDDANCGGGMGAGVDVMICFMGGGTELGIGIDRVTEDFWTGAGDTDEETAVNVWEEAGVLVAVAFLAAFFVTSFFGRPFVPLLPPFFAFEVGWSSV